MYAVEQLVKAAGRDIYTMKRKFIRLGLNQFSSSPLACFSVLTELEDNRFGMSVFEFPFGSAKGVAIKFNTKILNDKIPV